LTDHADPSFLGFVGEEVGGLGKRLTVQPPFGANMFVLLASSHLRIVANVLEIFQDERGTGESVLDDPLGEDMIAIPVEASLLPLGLRCGEADFDPLDCSFLLRRK
jgi:hypothetical protein